MAKWDAQDYHRHSRGQQLWARELLSRLALAGDERVLDLGCGDGKVTAEIARQVPRGKVVGIDNSAEMIQFATMRFSGERFPNLSFALMDVRSLRYREDFDVVFSNATLHWVVDHRPVLASIAEALAAGGRGLLQMGGRGNAAVVVQQMQQVIAAPQWRSFFEGFPFPYGFHDPASYRRWLTAAGLTPKRVELLPKDMVHDGHEGFAGWLRTTWLPYLERVPAQRRQALVHEVVERYVAAVPPDRVGKIHVQMVRLEVELSRDGSRAP